MEGRGRCGRERKREGGGQGCFFFIQLIDSQMSAVGFVVVVKHTFPFQKQTNKKNNRHTHVQRYSLRIPVE